MTDPRTTALLLRVVRGEPSPEELAAVVAVVSARQGAAGDEPAPSAPLLWATPQLRPALSGGPGAWRASGLPH